jgi:hypothetical protein
MATSTMATPAIEYDTHLLYDPESPEYQAIERRIVRKQDWRIMPLICLSYLLSDQSRRREKGGLFETARALTFRPLLCGDSQTTLTGPTWAMRERSTRTSLESPSSRPWRSRVSATTSSSPSFSSPVSWLSLSLSRGSYIRVKLIARPPHRRALRVPK